MSFDELRNLELRLEILEIEGGQFREREAVLRRIQELQQAAAAAASYEPAPARGALLSDALYLN